MVIKKVVTWKVEGKRVKYLEKVPTSVMDDPKSASIGDSNRACMMQHITHSVVDTCFGLV